MEERPLQQLLVLRLRMDPQLGAPALPAAQPARTTPAVSAAGTKQSPHQKLQSQPEVTVKNPTFGLGCFYEAD